MAATIPVKALYPKKPAIAYSPDTNLATVVIPYVEHQDVTVTKYISQFRVPKIEIWKNVDTSKGIVTEAPVMVTVPFATMETPEVVYDKAFNLFYVISGSNFVAFDPEEMGFVKDSNGFMEEYYRIHLDVDSDEVSSLVVFLNTNDYKASKIALYERNTVNPLESGTVIKREISDCAGLFKYLSKTINPASGLDFTYLGKANVGGKESPLYFLRETKSIYCVRNDNLVRIETKFDNAFMVDEGVMFSKVNEKEPANTRIAGATYAELGYAFSHNSNKLLASFKDTKKAGMDLHSAKVLGNDGVNLFLAQSESGNSVDIMAYSIPNKRFVIAGEMHANALKENFVLVVNVKSVISRIVFVSEESVYENQLEAAPIES